MSVSPDDMSFLDRLGVLTAGLDQKLQPFGGAANLGAALLANSGYSTTPRNFGQVLGTSVLQGQQLAAQRQNDQIKNQYMQAQIQALRAKPTMPTPASVAEYEYAKSQGFTGSFEEWQTKARSQGSPADVQSYEYFSKLSPEEKQNFLKLKRNVGSDFAIETVNGVPTVVYKPAAGGPAVAGSTPLITPLTNVDAQAAGAAQVAGAKTAAEESAKKTSEASYDLPRVERTVQQAVTDIQKLKDHPGLQYITGIASKVPIIPGTSQAAAQALADQVKGQTFLQAYQSLKGGGAITEVEGKKAEAAIARLNQAQSTADYKAALDDLSTVLQSGLSQAKKQAGKGGASAERKTVGGKTYVKQNGKWYEDDGT